MRNRATEEQAADGGYMIDEQVGYLLRLANQRHTALFASRIPAGLTTTQFAALTKLRQVETCSQNQLGRLISLDAATIKGVTDRLRDRGFVTIVADPTDRRRRAVALTQEGHRVITAAEKIAPEITAETLEPLTQDEQRTIIRLLKKLT